MVPGRLRQAENDVGTALLCLNGVDFPCSNTDTAIFAYIGAAANLAANTQTP